MKKSLPVIALLIMISYPLVAEDGVVVVDRSPTTELKAKVKPGFRMDVEGGASIITPPVYDPQLVLDRVGFHGSVFMGGVFNDMMQSLGLVADYRRHTYTHPDLLNYSPGKYGQKGSLNLIYVGPRYGILLSPYSKVAFIADLSLGYVKVVEKYMNLSGDWNAFGAMASVGCGFALGGNNYITLKVTAFQCKYKIDYYTQSNCSSINLSLGFTIGQ